MDNQLFSIFAYFLVIHFISDFVSQATSYDRQYIRSKESFWYSVR